MNQDTQSLTKNHIQDRIYTIRGMQVMLDRDLAELYNVSTTRLNQQVWRNIDRFPEDFMFQLNKKEAENLRLQNAISKKGTKGCSSTILSQMHGGRRYHIMPKTPVF